MNRSRTQAPPLSGRCLLLKYCWWFHLRSAEIGAPQLTCWYSASNLSLLHLKDNQKERILIIINIQATPDWSSEDKIWYENLARIILPLHPAHNKHQIKPYLTLPQGSCNRLLSEVKQNPRLSSNSAQLLPLRPVHFKFYSKKEVFPAKGTVIKETHFSPPIYSSHFS